MIKINLEKLEELDYARNEAFKSLRTNLSFCGADIKKILLTSCTPNEGKSTVSFYLAKALADDGKKVIFIDADLRKSVLIGRLGVKSEESKKIKGLSHYLTKQASLDEVICETNVPGLMMIFSGPVTPNPTELLGNVYMEKAMQELTEIADYVIVDAPPLGSVIDALILTKFCDGSVMVIENNQISYHLAQNVKKQLMQGGCPILGAILNKIDASGKGYYNGYYKKYYGRYGKYGSYGAYEKYGK